MIPSAWALTRPSGERLSGIDSLFLYIETPRTPMHSGSLSIFEGAPLVDAHGRLRMQSIRDEIEHRLHLVPKLRRRVVFGLFGEVAPRWVDDPAFDLANHVRHVALPPPGNEEQLTELCAEFMSMPLHREQPLWELWFIEGLEGGRIGLLEKIHHAMADGIAGVELATVLLDFKRHPAHTHVPEQKWLPHPPPGEARALAGDLLRTLSIPVAMISTGVKVAVHPLESARALTRFVDAAATVLGPRAVAPRSVLNKPIGAARRVALVRQSLEDIRVVEHRYGVTLNDVVLTAVAGGMNHLYRSRGENTEGQTLQVLVPVGGDHHGDHKLGNRVSAMLPRIGVGHSGPVTRLRAVAAEMGRCKRHRQALVGDALVKLVNLAPQPLLAATTPLVNRQPFVNVVVTNVPGTPFPMYTRGARLLEAFGLVPLAGNLSIGVAALSYDTELTIGLNADRDLCPDLGVLADGISKSFSELVSVARRADGAHKASEGRTDEHGSGGGYAGGERGAGSRPHENGRAHLAGPQHRAHTSPDGRQS